MRRLILFLALAVISVAAAAGAVSTAFSTASFTTDSTTSVQASTPGGAGNVMQVQDGDGQTAVAGTTVATAPSVLVSDAQGIPLSGATVVFAVASGGGSVSGATALTDSRGVAQAGGWTLGTSAGANTLTATAAGVGGGPATFTATATAGQAVACTVDASDTRPVAGSQVTITARFADKYGNAVGAAGILTTFTLNGSGLLSGSNPAMTDASGAATITLLTSTVSGATAIVRAAGPAASGASPAITTVAGPANSMVAVAGAGVQSATVGTAVPTAPSVLVTDANSNPVAGVTVAFGVTAGGGSVTGGNPTTDASGMAAVGGWTLGTTAGMNTLTVTASGLAGQVSFSALGTAGTASKYVVTPATSSPVAGAGVTITAQLADQYGNAVAASGISVTWTKTGTGGSLSSGSSTTAASGAATVTLTSATTAGASYTVTATSSSPTRTGTSPTITTVAGPASKISASAGTGQSATVGTPVATDPAVLVQDANNNAVSGVSVTFAVASGGGSVSPSTVTTNASGIATVTSWTLGTTSGANTLTATASGLTGSPVTFSATGTVGAATRYVVTASTSSPVAGATSTISAQLADQYGNAVATSGIGVTWTKTGTGGSLTSSSTTSSSGIATATLTTRTTAGTTYTVTATSSTPSSRTGTSADITSVAGAAYRMVISTGNSQTATVGTAVATDPSVLVTDVNGNPVPGFTVAFAAYSGGGSVTGGSATTNASGIAAVGSWTLGTAAGSNSLRATASVTVGSTLTFTATGAADVATKYVVTSNTYSPSAGSAVTITAKLTDQYGNSVVTSGITVTWSKTGTGGTFASATSTTNSSGVATVSFTTSSSKNRAHTVTATDSSGRTGTTPTITTK